MNRLRNAMSTTLIVALSGAASAQSLLHLFTGDSVFDRFGTVSGTGDVDQDGYPDLVVGARYDDSFSHDSGSVFVFSGKTGAVLHSFAGTGSYQLFGLAVGHAGDVDRDGYDDVLAGAYADSTNHFKSGAVKVFSGATGALLHEHLGETASVELGWAVSGAVDVDGDGAPDILAGAPDDIANPNGSGSARVYSGATGQMIYKMWGGAPGDVFGHSVSMVRDADGDGFGDFAVGAVVADLGGVNSGSVRVFSGRDGTILHEFAGAAPYDHFGVWVQDAGDVDADGRSDLVVGAYHSDAGGPDGGSVLVFSGASGAMLRQHHGVAGEHLGHSVSGAGDLDGDGHDDYLGGAPHSAVNGPLTGRVLVFSGRTGAVMRELVGDSAGDRYGASVSDAADVNGDGFADFIVGAFTDDKAGLDSGSAFVYSGCDDCVFHSYGVGCAGPAGLPKLYLSGGVAPGDVVSIEIEGGPPSSQAWLLAGTPGDPAPLAGSCSLLLGSVSLVLGPLPLDAGGAGAWTAPIAGALPAGVFAVQAIVAEPAVAGGYLATAAVQVDIP